MSRFIAIAIATLLFAGTAAAQPLTLTNQQMDRVSAGTFGGGFFFVCPFNPPVPMVWAWQDN